MSRGFAAALAAATALLVSSASMVALSLHARSAAFRSAAAERMTLVHVFNGAAPAGVEDPVLTVAPGGFEALLTHRAAGACALTAGGAEAPVLAGSGVPPRTGVRAGYCGAAPLSSGGVAVALSTPGGGVVTARSDAPTVPQPGRPLPGAVFGPVWLTAAPSGVYLVADAEKGGGCCGVGVWHSSDGIVYAPLGVVPERPGQTPDPATFFGAAAVAPGGVAGTRDRLFIPFTHAVPGSTDERELDLALSSDGGASWSTQHVFTDAPGTTVAAQYPAAAVDRAGAVYVTWSDIGHVFYAWARADAVRMNRAQIVDSGQPLNIMPSIVAGDAGHIAIAWYASGGDAVMGPGAARDAWRPMLALTFNAAGSAPDIRRATLEAEPVHRGSVCLLGVACSDGGERGPYDDRLGAHLGLAFDPASGALAVAYGDDSGVTGDPQVRLVEEACGDRILVRPARPLAACG